MNRRGMTSLFIALFLVMVLGGAAFAVSPAPLPDAFYGTISLSGGAVNGGIVETYINDKPAGTINYIKFTGNNFGGSGGFNAKLLAQAPIESIGQEIKFYVNGILATPSEKVLYVSQIVKQLNLTMPYNLVSADITTSANSVDVSKNISFTVKANYSNGTSTDVTASPRTHIVIENPNVFKLENGVLKALVAGTSKVTIIFGNQSKEFALTATTPSTGGGGGGGGTTPPPSTGGGGGTTPTTPVSKLNDIANNWSKDFILRLELKGIINGYADGTFKPDNNITRGEFIKMLVLSAGLTPSNDYTVLKGFKDYDKMLDWVKPFAAAALNAKLITGYSDKTLKLEVKINRSEVAVFVANALSGSEQAQLAFKDNAKIPSWSRVAIAKLISNGLINGYPDGNYKPLNFITRAEVAKILALFIDKK